MILMENESGYPEFIKLTQLYFEKNFLENPTESKLPLNMFKLNSKLGYYFPVNMPEGNIKLSKINYIELNKKGYIEVLDENKQQ